MIQGTSAQTQSFTITRTAMLMVNGIENDNYSYAPCDRFCGGRFDRCKGRNGTKSQEKESNLSEHHHGGKFLLSSCDGFDVGGVLDLACPQKIGAAKFKVTCDV